MSSQERQAKPLIGIVITAVALIALGYALVRLPVSGVQVIDPDIALIVVVIGFLLTGGWLFIKARSK